MSELKRLKRVFDSWLGQVRKRKRRRLSTFDQDDPRMIITELGLFMSPDALVYMTDSSTRREDFLMQIYAAEDELDVDLVKDNREIDPRWSPRVYEEDQQIVFTATVDGEEYVIAEFPWPTMPAGGGTT
ncbi:MAG: hypothetical protein AAGN35_09320 [Bacteroidota bacterium]